MSELTPAERGRIADVWSENGLLEHASIASFARFSLQLLSVAAPPELVAHAHRAALDEIHHARLCFRLAARFAERPISPGALSMDGVLPVFELPAIVAETVLDGCVGETIAAAEAQVARELAEDDEVRAVLDVIARDEADHAELAWKFLRWAVDTGGGVVHAKAERAFRDALSYRSAVDTDPHADLLVRYGKLDAERRDMVREQTLAEVLRPAMSALLDVRLGG